MKEKVNILLQMQLLNKNSSLLICSSRADSDITEGHTFYIATYTQNLKYNNCTHLMNNPSVITRQRSWKGKHHFTVILHKVFQTSLKMFRNGATNFSMTAKTHTGTVTDTGRSTKMESIVHITSTDLIDVLTGLA